MQKSETKLCIDKKVQDEKQTRRKNVRRKTILGKNPLMEIADEKITVSVKYLFRIGIVNLRVNNCPNRAEIRTVNFQVQYLLQFYQQNLKIMSKPFTGFL